MARRSKEKDVHLEDTLLTIALHEFSTHGYHTTTIDTIAQKANVSKGAVYWYFENKQALFLTIIYREFDQFTAYLAKIAQTPDISAIEKIRQLIEKTLHYYIEHPEFCGILSMINAPESPELSDALDPISAQLYITYRTMFKDILQIGIANDEFRADIAEIGALMLVGILEGVFEQWQLDPTAIDLSTFAPHIADICLHGFLKK